MDFNLRLYDELLEDSLRVQILEQLQPSGDPRINDVGNQLENRLDRKMNQFRDRLDSRPSIER